MKENDAVYVAIICFQDESNTEIRVGSVASTREKAAQLASKFIKDAKEPKKWKIIGLSRLPRQYIETI